MPSSLDAKDADPVLSPAFRISSLIMANISIEVLRRTFRAGGGTDTVELSSDCTGITVGAVGTAGPGGMGAGSGACASATVAGPLGCGGGGDKVGTALGAGAGGGSEILEEAEDVVRL